jgi:FixJ family two-component response regulator
MIQTATVISVVDDDPSVRRALKRLLTSTGFEVMTFASAREFLFSGRHKEPGCLVLDIHLGGMNGFDLQADLAASGSTLPIIFITAHDDPQTRERAMRSGAVAYLRKPFDDEALLEAILAAIGGDPTVAESL